MTAIPKPTPTGEPDLTGPPPPPNVPEPQQPTVVVSGPEVVNHPSSAKRPPPKPPIDPTNLECTELEFITQLKQHVEDHAARTSVAQLRSYMSIKPDLSHFFVWMNQTITALCRRIHTLRIRSVHDHYDVQGLITWAVYHELLYFITSEAAKRGGQPPTERTKRIIPSTIAAMISSLVTLPLQDGLPGLYIEPNHVRTYIDRAFCVGALCTMIDPATGQIMPDHDIEGTTSYAALAATLATEKIQLDVTIIHMRSLLGTGYYLPTRGQISVTCRADLTNAEVHLASTLRLNKVILARGHPYLSPDRTTPHILYNTGLEPHLTTGSYYQPLEVVTITKTMREAMFAPPTLHPSGSAFKGKGYGKE